MKKILVPTDFSRHAQVSTDVAADIARRSGANLILLHVVEEATGGSFNVEGEVSGGDIESCSITLKYKDGVLAQLFCSMTVETKKEAVIAGTQGMILIHTPWYKSMGLSVVRNNNEEKIPIPYTGNGFEFQIEETNRCLSDGLTESPLLPHDFMIMKAEVSDEIIRKAGVSYPPSLL